MRSSSAVRCRRRADCRAAPRRSAGRGAGSVPSKPTGRRWCGDPGCGARRPRRSAASGVPPTAARRIAARVAAGRCPVWPVVDEGEARAVAGAHVERAVGAEDEAADRVAGELLAPVLEQHLLGAGRARCRRRAAARAAPRRRSRRGRARRIGAAVGRPAERCPTAAACRRSRRRACRARRRTASPGSSGSSARPRRPRSQKLWTLVRRSAKIVGVGSVRSSKTLMRPLFSATNTRPSLANRTAVGCSSPAKTTDSSKPLGSVTADAARAVEQQHDDRREARAVAAEVHDRVTTIRWRAARPEAANVPA